MAEELRAEQLYTKLNAGCKQLSLLSDQMYLLLCDSSTDLFDLQPEPYFGVPLMRIFIVSEYVDNSL